MFLGLIQNTLLPAAAAAAAVLLAAPAPPEPPISAGWGEGQVVWGSCTWGNHRVSTKGEITVAANKYPDDNQAWDHKGPQSHYRMMIEAVNSWNYVLGLTYQVDQLRLKWLGYKPDNSPNDANLVSDIYFQPTEAVEGQNYGYTYVYVPGGRADGKQNCFVQKSGWTIYQTRFISKALIRTQNADWWFTQYGNDPKGYSVRTEWEECPKGTSIYAASGYTCSKRIDYGAIAAHELGHALGMVHPEQGGADIIKNGNCGRTENQATMCAYFYDHRSDQRTLSGWDRWAFNYLMAKQNMPVD